MSPPIVTVFRSRLRNDSDGSYVATAADTEARAREMPGFVDFKTFIADDGERVSLVTFESRATHDAWRDDPEHRAAQRRGRDEWFETYTIQVCELVDERSFP
ncbi:MAG: antibiotic biosynthesis monooxygenase [Acidimicrobiia bacterium]